MRRVTVLLAAFLVLAGCRTTAGDPSPGEQPLAVVATTTVLADLVRNVGGDRVTVDALIPKGGDVHTFDPAPSDATKLSRARLLVMNGLGLDDWLVSLARDAGAAETPIARLAEDLDGVEYIAGGDEHEADDQDEGATEEGSPRVNPHLWLDVANARRYVERLAEVLTSIDPSGGETFEANARAYAQKLADLDASIRQQLTALPPEHRRVVSFHDALPYFARAYGLEIAGVVVDAPGQEPSAAEVAALIATIRESGVRAILAEAQFSDRLAQAIADETSASVVRQLYTDSLGEPPADSYEGAMRWNTEQIVSALR